jgi:peroxin-6
MVRAPQLVTALFHIFDSTVGHTGVAYVSPVLAFNLQLVLHLSTFLGASRPQVFLQPIENDGVTTVRSARVSLVREPADAAEMLTSAQPPDTTEELDAALRVHFSTPRLLAQGDVFTIPVVEHANDDAAPRLTHFKVVHADPSSGVLCEDSMTLVLDGSTAAAAPPTRYLARFCQSSMHAPRTAHPSVEKVCRVVAPLMHPSAAQLRLRVSVLLKGPVGVGKRGVAHAVADALGMNIVVYNCHELSSGGGGCVICL